MIPGDILTEIVCETIAHVAGEEIKAIIDKILNGEDLSALVESGDSAALALQSTFVNAGVDPTSLTATDWAQFDSVAQGQFDDGVGNSEDWGSATLSSTTDFGG